MTKKKIKKKLQKTIELPDSGIVARYIIFLPDGSFIANGIIYLR